MVSKSQVQVQKAGERKGDGRTKPTQSVFEFSKKSGGSGAGERRQAVRRQLREPNGLDGDDVGRKSRPAIAGDVSAPAAVAMHGERRPRHGLSATRKLPTTMRDLFTFAGEGVVVRK